MTVWFRLKKEKRPLKVYCGYDPTKADIAFRTYGNHAEITPIPGIGTRGHFPDW